MIRFVTHCLLLSCLVAAVPAAAQTANPRLLGDINPGTAHSYYFPRGSAVLNDMLYTTLVDVSTGHELRSTDLSTVMLVTDLTSGPENGVVRVHSAGGLLFLSARNNATQGYELWTSDGTASGTVLCKDIFPGSEASGPDNYVVYGGNAAFCAADHTETYRVGNQKWTWYCRHLYISDGTTSGTNRVFDFALSKYGDGVFYLTSVNGLLYFDILQAPNTPPTDPRHYRGLARSDGTVNGSIVLVNNNSAGERSKPDGVREHYQALGNLVFFVNVSSTLGAELWKTDGTVSGTGLVKDIISGATGSNPSFLVAMGDYMYFTADDGVHGTELWRSDGTSSGTQLVADILPGSTSSTPQWLTPVGGKLYFTATGGSEGRQLWRYDPLAATPLERVAIINPSADCEPIIGYSHPEWSTSGFNPSYPDGFLPVANTLDGHLVYFVANDGQHGFELWQSDGTALGTRMVKDICVNCATTFIQYPSFLMNRVIFSQDDGIHGAEPWVLDPSAPLDYVYNHPPVVSLTATPTQGNDPLPVSFAATASDPDGSVTMYSWSFGDGASATGATLSSTSHTYSTPGSYTATVTVTDNGSATATASVGIIVTSANAYVYVYDQAVTRVSKPGGKWLGRDVVQVRDESQAAVSGAVVTVSYTGPNSGTLSGSTDASGSVTLETPMLKNPSGSWCFTVTNIQASGKPFDGTLGEPYACEGTTPKSSASRPVVFALGQNYPNPFGSTTQLTFSLSAEGHVRLSVHDLFGRHLRTVVNADLPAGSHCVLFDGTGLPPGTYSVQLDSPHGRLSRLITLQP